MRVTILGTAAAYPGAGEACSGFLVEEGSLRLLVDCGTGILSNLQLRLDLTDITDIVITHMHADHFFDLIPYRYALCYGLASNHRPRLYLPPDGNKVLRKVVSSFAESDEFFSDAFQISEYKSGKRLSLENVELHFVPVKHYIQSHGLAIIGAQKLAYSSDSGPCAGLKRVAKDADLFICNIGACLETGEIATWGHLSPEQAGTLAKEAGVRRLVLSHLWPACNRTLSLEQGYSAFGGWVELAEPFSTYDV